MIRHDTNFALHVQWGFAPTVHKSLYWLLSMHEVQYCTKVQIRVWRHLEPWVWIAARKVTANYLEDLSSISSKVRTVCIHHDVPIWLELPPAIFASKIQGPFPGLKHGTHKNDLSPSEVQIKNGRRFQVLTAASMKFRVSWDVASCSILVVDRRFRGAFCLHHHLSPWWWR
jgi:hypothetical protein